MLWQCASACGLKRPQFSVVFISGRCLAKPCTSWRENWIESESLSMSHCQTTQPIRASCTNRAWYGARPPFSNRSAPSAICRRTASGLDIEKRASFAWPCANRMPGTRRRAHYAQHGKWWGTQALRNRLRLLVL